MDLENRVVVLIDMDCFYCQVEEKLNPELRGKPIAVVQYNPWKGGGIIAVNYVARAMGVTRHMRGDEAKEKCPEIELPSVPCQRGKADISKYREAGKDVAKVLQKFTPLLERASIDEAYMDITAAVQERISSFSEHAVNEQIIPNTYALGYENVKDFISDVQNCSNDAMDFDFEHAKQLLIGSVIVSEIRAAVYNETGYRCSAGIAHNKILAKLVCGMNKPDKQTILPKHSINILYSTLSLKKVKHLGGKFGDTVCEVLKIKSMSQLQSFTLKELQAKFDEKNGSWLYNIARGIDLEPVQAKFNPKSIGCCKQFKGKNALTDLDSLRKWLTDLGEEIEDRLEKDALENNRSPKQLVVSFSTNLPDGRDVSSSRSYNFSGEDELCGDFYTNKALELIMESTSGVKLKGDESNRKLKAQIKFLGISVGKFEDNVESKKTKNIMHYFGASTSKELAETQAQSDKNIQPVDKKSGAQNNTTKDGKQYLMQKYLHLPNDTKLNEESKENKSELYLESSVVTSLDNQESFFDQLLNKRNENVDVENSKSHEPDIEIEHPTTPVCDITNCGENSNDTEYSGSTINMEINKSIALFEEDPEDVKDKRLDRVSSMRDLLNSSGVKEEIEEISHIDLQKRNDEAETISVEAAQQIEETFECPDCKKKVKFNEFDVHADYHIALTLRNEEKYIARQENRNVVRHDTNTKSLTKNNEVKRRKPMTENTVQNEVSSITGFLVKIDNTAPTKKCEECGKRVSVEKYAEHLDFHEAQRLNRELNKKPLAAQLAGSTVKRKRLSTSPVKKPKVPCKSIDSFFR